MEKIEVDIQLEEYKDLSANMKHYANMRFAQLTLFIVSFAGLLNLVYSTKYTINTEHKLLIKIIGVVFTLAFFIMEERAADYWHAFRKQAVEIEGKLGLKQYIKRPQKKYLTATNATRAIYISSIIFWSIQILCSVFTKNP